MRFRYCVLFFLWIGALSGDLFAGSSEMGDSEEVVIGTKRFTEGFILGEIFAQMLEEKGVKVKRSFGLGGTVVAFEALKSGQIDIYPDYNGTISSTILNYEKPLSLEALNQALQKEGFQIFAPLGFSNSYGLAMIKSHSMAQKLEKVSDLKGLDLKIAMNQEFHKRADGWVNLQKVYELDRLQVLQMDHALAYEALKSRRIDLMNVYTTDSKIKSMDLKVLEDDKRFFISYEAVAFSRSDFPASLRGVLENLEGQISAEEMIEMNHQAEIEKLSVAMVAQKFLSVKNLVKPRVVSARRVDLWARFKEHVYLTVVSLLLATVFSVTLAFLLVPFPKVASPVIVVTGLMQTIPSIALLAFMIPLFGIGVFPAIVGLFIYSLLPIFRNTYVALVNIDKRLIDSAEGIGLSFSERLFLVRLPLALPIILAGVRTATVICIGTATLAAFIGAGGLGDPIVSGLALNDHSMILQGAIAAALMAITAEVFFEILERRLRY